MSEVRPLRALLERLDPGMLAAGGRIRADPASIRVHGLRPHDDGPPESVFDLWLAVEDWVGFREAPPVGIRAGSVDDGRLWWTVDRGPFVAWDRSGWCWRVRDALERREPAARWPIDVVGAVEAYVGSDWVEQGVRLRLLDGSVVPVLVDQNTSVRDAMFYDGVDLDWDTSWCRQLARHLARGLGATYVNAT